jgi:hypothetical protein
MADNTTLNPGASGDIIATDDIGGVKHQRVKIEHGADGSATDVSTASPLPIRQYDPEQGLAGRVTPLRDIIVAKRFTVWGDSLADGLATEWTQTTANGGTITSTLGEGQLKTSTATNGSSKLTSPNIAYIPGETAWFNSAVRFNDTGTAGDIRRIGMFTTSGDTPQEGWYYELSGTTLNAVYVKAGTPTAVASGSWSEFASAPFTLDTNYHSFEIHFTANKVWFIVDNVLRHVAGGSTSAAITTSLTLPITIQNVKTSGATDITFAVRNVGSGRFGDTAADRLSRKLVAHIDPDMQVPVTKTAFNATTTQTGIAMWTPASGKRIAITSLTIGTYGTTAARVIIWIGASGDTTYTAGTDHAVVIASFAPSATVKPGLVITPASPVYSKTADHILRITTDAAISIDVTWNGYEF